MRYLILVVVSCTLLSFGQEATEWDRLIDEGRELSAQRKYEPARVAYSAALAIARQEGITSRRYALSLNELGLVELQLENYSGALPLLVECVAVTSNLGEFGISDTLSLLNNLGYAYRRLFKFEDAESIYNRGISLAERHSGHAAKLATLLINRAQLRMDQGRFADAQSDGERALKIQRASGDRTDGLAAILAGLGRICFRVGQYREAERYYRQSLQIRLRLLGADHPETVRTAANIGAVLQEMNRYSEAERLLTDAIERSVAAFGEQHPERASFQASLAAVYVDTNREREAEPLFRSALAILQNKGNVNANIFPIRQSLAVVLFRLGQVREAEHILRDCLRDQEALYGARHIALARTIHNLAAVVQSRGDLNEAEILYRRAISMYEMVLGAGHLETAISLAGYSSLLRATNRKKEASALRARAEAIAGERLKDYGAAFTVNARALRAQSKRPQSKEAAK